MELMGFDLDFITGLCHSTRSLRHRSPSRRSQSVLHAGVCRRRRYGSGIRRHGGVTMAFGSASARAGLRRGRSGKSRWNLLRILRDIYDASGAIILKYLKLDGIIIVLLV